MPKSQTNQSSVYYKEYDLFSLKGLDTLNPSTEIRKQNNHFVKVTFKKEIPITIIYHLAKRQIVLNLEDSMHIEGRTVYVYYTGNLLGGKAGRQREYSTHYIDNGYKLYVNLSDTILVKRYDNIDVRDNKDYHYMIDVYTQQHNKVNYYSLLQNTRKDMPDDSLFIYWRTELNQIKPQTVSTVLSFPPE